MLASPEVGFIVPTKAMTSSGQKSRDHCKTGAGRRHQHRRGEQKQPAGIPVRDPSDPQVSMAVPINVLVTIAPIASALNPSSTR